MFSKDKLKGKLGAISAKTLTLGGNGYVLGRNEQKIKFQEAYAYTPLSGPRSFRLLRINPGADTDVIAVELYEANLDDNPKFDALSYTWDLDPSFSLTKMEVEQDEKREERPILCNGSTLHITMNLYHALIEFRRMKLELPIWADQVCINQQDNTEKVAQLAIMTDIYEVASTVVIWLGVLNTIRNRALDFMEALPESPTPVVKVKTQPPVKPTVLGTIRVSIDAVQALSGSIADLSRWLATLTILQRQWFRRVWTLQEFLLADRFKIIMGNREIAQSSLIKAAAQAIEFFESNPGTVHLGLNMMVNVIRDVCQQRAILFEERNDHKTGKRYTAEEYVVRVRNRQATVAKDKVFAGAAVLEGGNLTTVGYWSTTQQIYMAFASDRLWPQTGMFSLSLVGGCAPNIEGLPSWVPDLSTIIRPRTLRHCGCPTGWPAISPTPSDYRIEGATLHLKGTKTDTVTRTGETSWSWNVDLNPYNRGGQYRGLITAGQQMGKMNTSTTVNQERFGLMFALLDAVGSTYPPTGETTLDAFWNTLIGGAATTTQDSPSVWRIRFKHFLAFRYLINKSVLVYMKTTSDIKPWTVSQIQDLPHVEERLANFLQAHDHVDASSGEQSIKQIIQTMANSMWGPDGEKKAGEWNWGRDLREAMAVGKDQDFYPLVGAFGDLFGSVYDGRRIFLTDAGLLGISSEGVKAGDVIYWIKGAEVPYVLRPVDGQEATFTLVGEAYVHGLKVEGEAEMDAMRIL